MKNKLQNLAPNSDLKFSENCVAKLFYSGFSMIAFNFILTIH